MPEVVARRSVAIPLAETWEFVREFDNWAPMLTGYESHETHSVDESTWALTGDLGPFSKTVHLRIRITEWVEAERVAFTLEGIDEQVQGSGCFDLSEQQPVGEKPPPRTWWQRLWDRLWGRPAPTPELAGPVTSHVVFTFAIDAGGPMGPMINAMLGPYAETVAQRLLADVSSALAPATAEA